MEFIPRALSLALFYRDHAWARLKKTLMKKEFLHGPGVDHWLCHGQNI